MKRRLYLRFTLIGVFVVIVGLALGKGRGDEDSLVNDVSAVLLTVGVVTVVVFAVLELVRRARNGRASAGGSAPV
jgi:hypothetical protein